MSITAADVRGDALPAVVPVGGGSALDRDGKPTVVRDPSRVVSVAPGAAETIAALGLAGTLVGRDIASDAPLIHAVPVVTDAHALSVEKVLAVRPTLLIIDPQTTPAAALDAVERAGIQTVRIPQAFNLDAVAPRIEALARVFGVPAQASRLVKGLRAAPADASPAAVRSPRVAFLYVRGTAAVYLLGGRGSGADSLIEAAGGVDVGAEAGLKPFTPITPEVMADLQPTVLLVMTKGLASVGGIDGLRALPGVKQTPAAREGRVIDVEDTMLLAFGMDSYRLVAKLRSALQVVTGD